MRTLLSVVALAAAALAQSPVRVTKTQTPNKSLVFEVTVPAPVDAVWEAFATSQGLSTWLTPGAVVDLRKGGEWTAHYPGGKTGGGTILAFTPKREMILSAMAPEQLSTVRAERTTATFQFAAGAGGSTAVRLVQTGWKEGAEWDQAYDYLAQGNAQLLETLRRRFVSGPIDWAKEWGVSR
ncbi:MAG: SRPBCC domain-containing protein [Acidobacteriia bacterium]|nr:SRPBCC domain-containing protein [Terriglobia bacterium]